MFDFIFKRAAGKPVTAPSHTSEQAAAASAHSALRRAEQTAQAQAVAGDEAAALALILSSEFADVRLLAAAHVWQQATLEQVHLAMRNTDRRVAKLMQARLDVLRHAQAELQKAQLCLDSAQHLLGAVSLSANQVAELDRQWLALQAPQLGPAFAVLRSGLTQRLAQQVALQRAVLDAVAELRRLAHAALAAPEMAAIVQRLSSAHAEHVLAAEHASLPKQLLKDFSAAQASAEAALHIVLQHQSAAAARQAALSQWQGADPVALQAELLKRAWQDLPRLPEGALAEQLQAQFDAILASAPAPASTSASAAAPGPKPQRSAAPLTDSALHFMAALDAMDAALQQGLLQQASEHDRALRESKGVRLSPAQSERLAQVRAEFKHLADWARWGGNVSREELVKATEELPVQQLSVTELAKKIGSLRERWKSLDSLSGTAPKVLWERFDAACAIAYAPAALHFKHLTEERHINLAKAEALLAEVLATIDSSDWKQVAAATQRLRQAWSRLGTIERKEKKRLDASFSAALSALEAPLEQQRQIEVARREQLIVEVARLKPNERNTLDMLRALQEKWQELAKVLPLERRTEQALWHNFRTACDAVFAQRKDAASAADQERRVHLHACEALCLVLEVAAAETDELTAAGATLLHDTKRAWQAMGPVPRAAEQKIGQRYQAALTALQARLDGVAQRAGAAQANALRDKLRLCQALENALTGTHAETKPETETEIDWALRWRALPVLNAQYERTLAARFDAASALWQQPAGAYAALLESNRGLLQQEVLRLEIVARVDSGAEFARDRLKLQIGVLQSTLKSGQSDSASHSPLLQLCALPALADARTVSRIEVLLRRMSGATEAA